MNYPPASQTETQTGVWDGETNGVGEGQREIKCERRGHGSFPPLCTRELTGRVSRYDTSAILTSLQISKCKYATWSGAKEGEGQGAQRVNINKEKCYSAKIKLISNNTAGSAVGRDKYAVIWSCWVHSFAERRAAQVHYRLWHVSDIWSLMCCYTATKWPLHKKQAGAQCGDTICHAVSAWSCCGHVWSVSGGSRLLPQQSDTLSENNTSYSCMYWFTALYSV